ncbi:MAG: FG-GAP-like repeat-containing protein [Acidimicrobiia bacterium]|nr:MAG: FG-GAP-like repeat-containing protein [Acidimicrobiia bacterium]
MIDSSRRPERRILIAGLVLILVSVVVAAIVAIRVFRQTGGDPGNLTESLYELSPEVPLPQLTDATSEWGLGQWINTSRSHLSGGAALGDLDGDGLLDLVLTGGNAGIFFNDGDRFVPADGVPKGFGGEMLSTAIADLDGDGLGDILMGPQQGDVLVIWGDPWVTTRAFPLAVTTTLPGGNMSTGFATADLDGDGLLDIVRIAYGESAQDVLFHQVRRRAFEAVALPSSGGKSLAAEIADVDGDGALDIWVTRDVGWQSGADSLYTRTEDGTWQDIAPDLGVAMEIDGMGVTVADLTGDGVLDGYLSDIGENEFLVGTASGFTPTFDSGAARIRPPGADDSVVSSSWASGAADINLDGILDLVVVNGGFPFHNVENKIGGTSIEMDDPPAIFLGLGDGRYADAWSKLALGWEGPGRGLAMGDIDNDGDTDFVVTRLGAGPILYRNDSTGTSITVRPAPGCPARGAVVSVGTESGTITQLLAAHSFLGSHAPEVVVGRPLPGSEILVRWPGGLATRTTIADPAPSSVTVRCAP